MMEIAFYFILKTLFVLKFFLNCLVIKEKRLDEKDKINFKNYEVTTWLTNNYNRQLPNISRSKGNQKVTFPQLIEYNERNILLQKACGK